MTVRTYGAWLFKDILAVHFSPMRPADDEWADHEIIVAQVWRGMEAR